MQNSERYELELRQTAAQGKLEEVKRLIDIVKANGNLNAAGPSSRQTALHRAAEKKNNEIISLLLEAGANPTLKDNQGKTALNLYLASTPYGILTDKTDRCINREPSNTLDLFIREMCKQFRTEGSAKDYFLCTPQGDIIFAKDPLELSKIALPFQEQMYQNQQFGPMPL